MVLEKNIEKMKKNMVKHLENFDVTPSVATTLPILPTPLQSANVKPPPKRKRMKNDFLHRVSNFGKIVLDKLKIIR